jgi:hypothetical protein
MLLPRLAARQAGSVALVAFLLNGCAGAQTDPDAPVASRFESDPAGASVFVDGGFVGVTPTAFHLPAKGTVEVRLELHDHFPATARLDRRVGTPETAPAGVGWEPVYYWPLVRK